MTRIVRLDDRLEDLAAEIIDRIDIDPPDLKTKLRPPQLRVIKGPRGVNCLCVARPDGGKIILLGANLYSFLHHFTRAAATYFIATDSSGVRPSLFWPRACSAFATALDWIFSPASIPHFPDFDLSQHQAEVAREFGDYAYRFALCHEIAHIALEHVDATTTEPRHVGTEDVEVYRTSQQHELAADQFGLELLMKSLPNREDFVTALAASVYFIHATGLRDARLMLLQSLVDYQYWKIAYTHPPTLQRVLNLMSVAERLYQLGEGLKRVHESLNPLIGELQDVARRQQDDVADAANRLVDGEVARAATVPAATKAGSAQYDAGPATIQDLLRLLNQSPLGVLRALEPASVSSPVGPGTENDPRALVSNRLATDLPEELQRFRGRNRRERAELLA